MSYWYDAEVMVRVYLPGKPDELDPEDVELAVQGAIDDAGKAVLINTLADGREYRHPMVGGGLLLSCHGVDLGEPHGYEE